MFPVALASRLALDLDIVELDVQGLSLGLGDVIGKFQGLHHGFDGVLVFLDVVDAHVDAAALNVGEVLSRYAARVREVSTAPGLAVVFNGVAFGPSGVGLPLCLVVEQLVGVLVGVEDRNEAVARVLALGELKLGPVGGVAATSVISTPSGTSTLNQMKSVLISTAGFSAPPPPPLPVAPPLPPQPTRATAAKRLMQRVRIAKAFFFMVVSSSICNRPWITCLYCTRGRLARVGHVSHSGGWICADKWQYARAQKRGGLVLSALPGLGARCFNGAHVRGCA